MVREQPEPERVEIELSSSAEELHRRRLGETDPTPQPDRAIADAGSDGDGDVVVSAPVAEGPVGGDRRRMFVVVTIVAVLGLVLGWLIGRSGGSDEVATLDATVPATTEPEQTELLPGDTLPSAATTTTRPRRTTTTSTLVPTTRELVDVDPRLEGVELTLVGAERFDVLVELDLATGTLTSRDLGGIRVEPGAMVVGDDWVVIANPGGGQSWLVGDDGSRQQVDLGEQWELLWRVGTDRFWRSDQDFGWGGPAFGEPSVYTEVDVTGEPTGTVVELPFDMWSWQTDPGGGLLVEQAGKLYSVDESSIELIGTGELVALSGDVAVLHDCDEQLRCGLYVTDRLTGDVRPVPVDAAVGDSRRLETIYGWGSPTGQSIAPDGSMCAVVLPAEDDAVLALLDLGTGAMVELGQINFPPTVVWSSDDRFVFFIEGGDWYDTDDVGGVTAYDRRTGDVFPVLSDVLEWQALSARPA